MILAVKQRRRLWSEPARSAADAKIMNQVMRLQEYQSCEAVLTYISTALEVDTHQLVKEAHVSGKVVAAPRCKGDGLIDFLIFEDINHLKRQSFGLLEPRKKHHPPASPRQIKNSICIVPGFAYDCSGYRLKRCMDCGYDHFLALYPGLKIGLVYEADLRRQLWRGKFDIAVDLVITEKRVIDCVTN